jgi:hypothetical protein
MLTRVTEMINALHSRPNASAGFTAKEVYEVGKVYGLTCREIGQTFLGKSKSIGYSRYLPQMPDADVIAAIATGSQSRSRKPVAAKKVAVEPEIEHEIIADSQTVDVPESAEEDWCWIATPEEIAEELEIAPIVKQKPQPKQRKVKIS